MLSHLELVALVKKYVLTVGSDAQIGSASIDITLDKEIMVESKPTFDDPHNKFIVDLMQGETLNMEVRTLGSSGYDVIPKEFILASSREDFKMPDDLVGVYYLNSSLGRSGLEHMMAGFIDPGFHGKLTLEMFNATRFHTLRIREGMKIGQIAFHKVKEVPEYASYRTRGQYNGQTGVTQSKGLRTPK